MKNTLLINALGIGLALSTSLVMTGCGQDCGDGTEEVDGVCIANTTVAEDPQQVCGEGTELRGTTCEAVSFACGEGTMVVEGACVGELICGLDTEASDGACVPADTVCGQDSVFDTDSGTCVASGGLICGLGTVATDDGSECVPDLATACGPGSTSNADETACIQSARVQVVHMAADPAAMMVDVYLANGDGSDPRLIADDFQFRTATRYLDLAPGTYDISINASGSTGIADQVLLPLDDVVLTAGLTAQLVARGVADATQFDTTENDAAAIALTVDVFADALEADPDLGDGRYKVRVLHASTDAPAVDVEALGLDGVPYGANTGATYLELDAGVVPFDVNEDDGPRLASFQTSVAGVFPAPAGIPADLVTLVVANGFLDPSANQDGAAFGLHAVLASGAVAPLDSAARVQLVHAAESIASADVYAFPAGTPPTSGDDAIQLDFRQATGFLTAPSGAPQDLYVVAAGGDVAVEGERVISDLGVSFAPNSVTRVVAIDTDPAQLLKLDSVEAPMDSTAVAVQVLHGSSDAGTVDVFVEKFNAGVPSGAPVADDVMFGGFTAVAPLDAANRVVTLTDSTDPAAAIASTTAPLKTLPGASLLVIASGSGDDFGVIAVAADGDAETLATVVTLDAGTAELQAIHNSNSAGDVDIYIGGDVAASAFTFRTATPFLNVPIPVDVEVTATGMMDDVAGGAYLDLALTASTRTVAVAAGDLPFGMTGTSFRLFTQEVSSSVASGVELNVFHGSTDAGPVDIQTAGMMANIADNLMFGMFAGVVPLTDMLDMVDLEVVVDPDDTASVVSFSDVDVSGFAGTAVTVCASGLVGGSPDFGLLAVSDADTNDDGLAEVVLIAPDPAVAAN
ncbi:MAG: DUF4397 domain-containing protein [Myxococcota bacterium]